MKNDYKPGNSIRASFVIIGLLVFNAVHSAYIINHKPKIGAYHIWLCSAFGAALVIFSVLAIIFCIGLLKRKEGTKGLNVCLLILTVFLLIVGTDSALPYWKDVVGGETTVETNSYLAIYGKLEFLDNNGDRVTLYIPDETATELRIKGQFAEYDRVNILVKYYDPITVTYYPNSGVIVDLSSDN